MVQDSVFLPALSKSRLEKLSQASNIESFRLRHCRQSGSDLHQRLKSGTLAEWKEILNGLQVFCGRTIIGPDNTKLEGGVTLCASKQGHRYKSNRTCHERTWTLKGNQPAPTLRSRQATRFDKQHHKEPRRTLQIYVVAFQSFVRRAPTFSLPTRINFAR